MLALKTSLILAAALLLTAILRRQSAALRHLILTLALAATLAVPFLSVTLPALRVPEPPGSLVFRTTAQPSGAKVQRVGQHTPAAPHAPSFSWSTTLTALWFVGTSIFLLRTLLALLAVARLRRAAVLRHTLGDISIYETPAGSMPIAFGILRPAIALPADAVEWSADRHRAACEHELAHIRRRDPATHLLARIALAAHWWNPLAWLTWKQFVNAQECAADDLVLAAGTSAPDYAEHLLDIARSMVSPTPLVSVPMARKSQLESRLAAILDSTVNRRSPSYLTAALIATVLVVALLPLAAARPQAPNVESSPDFDMAQKLLDEAAALYGDGSINYANALMRRAAASEQTKDIASADSDYRRAAEILGARPEAAPAVTWLGAAAITRKDYAAATDWFTRLHAITPGLALMWQAIVAAQSGQAQRSQDLFRQAIAIEGTQSAEAAVTLKTFAEWLRRQGNDAEAAAIEAQAKAAQDANAHPPAELPSSVLRMGEGVHPPAVTFKIDPEYTLEARAARLQGTVTLAIVVDPDGTAEHIQVLKGLGLGLDQQAALAIRRWHFQPGTKDGQPVPVRANIEVNFRLS